MQFEDEYRARFPKAFEKPAISEGDATKLAEIMGGYRDIRRNPGYGIIEKLKHRTIAMITRLNLIEEAEDNFTAVLYDALKADPGALKDQKMRNMQAVRAQLADIYADNAIEMKQFHSESVAPGEKAAQQELFHGYLAATLSAYLFNMMKEKKLIDENMKPGLLYDRPNAAGQGRG